MFMIPPAVKLRPLSGDSLMKACLGLVDGALLVLVGLVESQIAVLKPGGLLKAGTKPHSCQSANAAKRCSIANLALTGKNCRLA